VSGDGRRASPLRCAVVLSDDGTTEGSSSSGRLSGVRWSVRPPSSDPRGLPGPLLFCGCKRMAEERTEERTSLLPSLLPYLAGGWKLVERDGVDYLVPPASCRLGSGCIPLVDGYPRLQGKFFVAVNGATDPW
jgi:hypothetical protein